MKHQTEKNSLSEPPKPVPQETSPEQTPPPPSPPLTVSPPEKPAHFWEKDISIGGTSLKDVIYFTKNLHILLTSGIPLLESLQMLEEQLKGKMKRAAKDMYSVVEVGQPFSAALTRHERIFGEMYINIIKIGESTGKLEYNLEHLTEQLEKKEDLKRKIISALIYPSIVLIGGIGLMLGITAFVLPKVSRLFLNFDVELPFTTRALIAVSGIFDRHGFLVVGLGIACVSLVIWLLKRESARPMTHWLTLHIPLVKQISRHLNMAFLCRTVSLLLDSGIPIDDSLKIAADTLPNIYYRNILEDASASIKAGNNLSGSMSKYPHLIPKTDLQIIIVGERSGTLQDSLKHCSMIHEADVDDITKNLSTILEPILLAGIGLMIGFLALAIISPIYSITGKFQR